MADVNANIGVNIDTTQALAQLKALQRQISQFHTSIAKGSETAALAQRDLQRNFINSVNSIGAFSAELRTVKTTAESFTESLEKNKFSMREYFRYAGASTKTFGKLFKSEFDTIGKVAEDRVKKLQTQYIKLGRDTTGAMKAIAIMPNQLDMKNWSVQTQLAAQRQAIFNQLIRQGSTNLLNFGKNTQWAGRQLMVGFTLPLATLGTTAARTFMEMEAAALKFRKVYGDLFTPRAETQQALADITALGQMFTKYGIAVKDTVGLAAEAAAAGFQGVDLQRQTTQATRLSVLGQIDNQKALETTISLQNAFKMSSESLASAIDFLNAVENQTVVSLDDITTAIPKVAPVIQQLGGDVKDLAFFMAAMKEGGVNASEGANALKSGLASLINPTEKASDMLASMGINIKQIIEANKGNLKATVIEFARALDTLDPLTRARAIEQLFGKFQFARLSTLFDNVINQTGQAARVLDLAGTSVEDLAALSEQELGMTADSAMNKFRKSVEDMKMALVPVGQTFLEAVTPIVEFIGGILEKFNNLSSGVKKAIVVLTVAIGAIGPVALMTFGLLANGLANIVKGAMILRQGYLRLTGQTQILGEQTDYLTTEQINATAVAHSLDQSHAKLTQTFNVEARALNQLILAYDAALRAATRFASVNPGMMLPPRGRGFNNGTMNVKKYANGVTIVPGNGNGDTVPAMLTPGEAVIPKDRAKQYAPLIQGIIAGNIPGYQNGLMFGGKQYEIPMTGRTSQSALNEVFLRFSKDVEGITIALDILEQQARELGSSFGKIGADRLKQLLDELGVQRNRPKGESSSGGFVFAHGQERGSDITDISEIERLMSLANTTEEGVGRFLKTTYDLMLQGEQAAKDLLAEQEKERVARQELITAATDAERQAAQAKIDAAQEAQRLALEQIAQAKKAKAYSLSNFGFILPEGANKEEFSPAQVAQQFQGQNVSRTMAPVYSEYAKQLGMTLDQALNNPEVAARMHEDVGVFASRIAGEIGDSTEGFLTDPQFYSAVERARAGLGDAVSSILISAIDEMKKTSTLVTFGGQANRGGTGQRTGLAFSETALREDIGAGSSASYVNVGTEAYRARGEKVAQATVQGMAAGAGTKSPSRETIPIGEDLDRGLEVGMMNRADEVAAVAASVSDGAVNAMRPSKILGPRGEQLMVPVNPPTTPSAPVASITEGSAINKQTTDAINAEIAARKTMQGRLASMNNMLMAGTFALTSLAGAGSMAGGKLGELSQAVFKYSGLLFGLMSITQLLTQQKILELAASRAATAGLLVGNVATKKMVFNSSLFAGGIKKLLPNLLRFGGVLLRMIGLTNPIGLVIAGLTGMWLLTKKVNEAKEKERLETYGLAEAMRVTAGQAKTLGDFFGVVAGRSAFESRADLRNREVVGAQTRSERDKLRQDEGFQKEFKTQIESFRKASNQEATLAFQSLAIDLKSRGFASEQVQTIIDALREESGQTDVKFNVKSIDFSPESLKSIQGNLTKNLDVLKKTYQTGFEKVLEYKPTGGRAGVTLVEKIVPTKELERQLANVSSFISTTAKSAATMFEGGMITGEQYTQTINGITIQMNALDAAQRKAVLIKVFQEMGVGAEALIANLKDAKQQMMVLALLSAGILTKDSTIMQDIAATGADAAMRHARGIYGLQQAYDKWFGSVEKVTAAEKKNKEGSAQGTGEKSPYQKALEALQGQNKELWAQAKAFKILTKSGMDAATALEYASDATIALGIATGNIKPDKLKVLTDLMAKIEQKAQAKAIREFFVNINKENKLNKSFAAVIPQIVAMGGKLEEINMMMDNPNIMKDLTTGLKNGRVDAEKIAKYLNVFKQQKAIKIQVQLASGFEGQRDFFNEMKSKAEEYFNILEEKINDDYEDAIRKEEGAIESINRQIAEAERTVDQYQRTIDTAQRKIELELSRPIEILQEEINDISREIEMQFTRPIEDIQKTIDDLQRGIEIDFERPIAALQEESSDLANEMTLMDKAAEAINAKYDAQADALNKVSEINQEIIAQQKSQISLADALTQGDISAAAQAAQEMRAQAAESASKRAGGVLDAARQAELGGLRTAGGLTREQVEARQFQIGQQTFALEEQREAVQARILVKQDAIYKLEQARALKQEEIRVREDAIYKLEEKREAALLDIRITEDIIYGIQNNQIRALNDQKLVHELNLQKINDQKNAELEKIRIQREAWSDAQLAIDLERIKQGEFNDVIEMTNDLLAATKGKIDGIIAKIMAAIQAAMQLAAAMASVGSGGGGGGGGGEGDIGPGEGIDPDDSMKAANAASVAAAASAKVTSTAAKATTTAAKATSTAAKSTTTAAKATTTAAKSTGSNTIPKSSMPFGGGSVNTKSSNTIPKSSMPFGGASIIPKTGGNTVPKSSMPFGGASIIKSAPVKSTPATVRGVPVKKKMFGGFIKKMAAGGVVPGAGMTDKVPALLTPGEFVVNRGAAKSFAPFLSSINDAKYPSMIGRNMSSPVYSVSAPNNIYAMPTNNSSASVNDNSSTVYNYSVGITVGGTNSSPDSIAKAVLNEIKYIDSQRIRNQRA